jgi:PAS domain S-box-containing protein
MIGANGSGQAGTMITAIERIAGIGDWRMPASGRLITLSANACRLLRVEGMPPDTLEGLIALYDPQDQPLLRDACARVLSGSEEKRFEVDARMKVAGREVWFRHRAEVCPAPPDGTVTLICVLQDVSREKIDALESAALKAQAQREKDRLQAAASAGIVGVWDWDVTRNVLAWDEVMYRLYGLKAEDFGGAFEAWTSAVHPDDRAGAEEAIAAALRGEREYEYLFRVVWPTDGSTHFIKAASRTSFDASGKAFRIIGVNYDVTEQIEREQALKDATRVAEEANRAKSEFLARMSHEIRTPMNAVIGLSAMSMELPDIPLVAADCMRRIHQSSSALMATINDILDFSKIEALQMDLDPQEFELEALIENSVDLFGLAAHHKGLQLVIDVDQALPRFLVGDAPRLTQILNNLLGNAIKFTESGQILLSVRRLPSAGGRKAHSVRLHFSVRDSGIGIASESIAGLFQPFAQADVSISRRFGGSGLGLVISQRLCELMGGSITVESQPGVGTTFSFELELPIGKWLAPLDATRLLFNRVLVVDDLAQERQMIVSLLEHWNVDVVEAGGGREAIELISRSVGDGGKPFDLVLLDWDMPEVDGLDVARWVQKFAADAQLPATPLIVMVTALDREQLMREAGGLKLEDFLQKPITASRLLQTLSGRHAARLSRASWPALQDQRRRAAPIAGAHVLVVEDTADSQVVARMMLERLGLRVTVAGNGQQALDLLEDVAVDIILMDVHMPVMDGLQATRLIRQRRALDGVPVLAMTAASLPKDRRDCAAAGMVDVITKPVDPAALLELLLPWVKPRATATDASAETAREDAELPAWSDGFPEIAGIDRLDAASRLLGNATLFHSLLVRASTGCDSQVHAAISAAQRGDRAEAAHQVHALRGSLGNLGARDACALAARVESSLRSNDVSPPIAALQELEQTVTALTIAIRHYLTTQAAITPIESPIGVASGATPAVPDAAALQALLALLDVHNVKALECWQAIQPAIEARKGADSCAPLRAAMAALDFTEAARLVRRMEAEP